MDVPNESTQLEEATGRSEAETVAARPFFQDRLPLALRYLAGILSHFFKRFATLVSTVVKEFLKDECLNLAAQISYFALFSIFPLILGIVLIVSFLYQDPLGRATLLTQITNAFPNNTVDIAGIVNETLQNSQKFGPLLTILFFLGLIWGGSGLFDAISYALNKAWQIPGQQRGIIESLTMRFLLYGFFFLLLIGSIGVSLTFEIVKNFAETNPELSTYLNGTPIWDWLAVAIPWGLNFVTFMILYRVVPQRKVTFFDVWPGAILATVLLELLKIGFNFYVTKIVHYSATYGSLSGVVVFIFWLYLLAVVVLLGGEMSSVYAEMRGDKHPAKLARQGQLTDDPNNPNPVPDDLLPYGYTHEELTCFYAPPSPDQPKS
jgi:membrane protein